MAERQPIKQGKAYHAGEASRIAMELVNLGPGFTEDGIIRTVLRERVEQEMRRSKLGCDYCAREQND